MASHALAAAQLCRHAACHLAAGGDRAGYWRLLAEADLCIGVDGLSALAMAIGYERRAQQSPQPIGPGAPQLS